MNPLKYLSPALYARLHNALVLDGVAVPVYENPDANIGGHYVLLQQPTHVPEGGSQGCYGWSCTALVDVVTQFPTSAVSGAVADELLDQISNLLDGQSLDLPEGWQCGKATFEPSQELKELTPARLVTHRLVRYRYRVYYTEPELA